MRIKIIFIFLIFWFWNINLFSQTYEDYIDKGNAFQMTNLDSSIFYFKKAEVYAVDKKDSVKIAFTLSHISQFYRMRGDFKSSISYAKRTVSVANNQKDKAKSLINLAVALDVKSYKEVDSLYREAEVIAHELQDSSIYFLLYISEANAAHTRGDYYEAIDYYLASLDYYESDFSRVGLYQNIANTFYLLNNLERAEEYILKSIGLCQKNNYKFRNDALAVTYGKILKKLQRYEEANIELNNAIEYLSGKKKWSTLSEAYNVQTNLFLEQEMWQEAEIVNKKALELFPKSTANGKVNTLVSECKILLHQKQFNNVITKANEVIQLAKKAELPRPLQQGYFYSYKAFQELNNHELALENYINYQSLNDSLFRSKQTSLVTNLESKHNRKEKDNAIALLDSQNETQTIQLSQQKKMLAIGGIALAIISGLLFFLLQSFKKIKIQNEIISTSLKEKDTLLREIHHRVKNNLQLVSSLLGLQSRSITDPKALEALNSGKARVKSMALIHQDLYNRDNLTGINVKEYLEKLCRELISTYQIDTDKINLQAEIENLNIDVDTLVPLGLIINELLTNALKYAYPNGKGGNIFVKLFEKNGQLFLEIKDDGIGMDISKKSKDSFGFKLVNTLLYQLEGNMNQIEDEGTHLVLTFSDYKIAA